MNAHKFRKPRPDNEDGLTSDEEDNEDEDDQDIMDMEEREARITKAHKHVAHAKRQRELLNLKVQEARDDAALKVPHRLRRYCLVADYCQNMALPHFGGEQPGET